MPTRLVKHTTTIKKQFNNMFETVIKYSEVQWNCVELHATIFRGSLYIALYQRYLLLSDVSFRNRTLMCYAGTSVQFA